MTEVKVYQIGVGSFGRYGFEKFVDMANHLQEVDLTLEGVCDKDPDRLEKAQRFAQKNNIEIKLFRNTEEMYRDADEQDEKVLVYDASSAPTHATHIHESLQRNFYHIAEKPPSMTREQHLQEKKLAENKGLMWKVDFIERESPVVQKTLEIIEGKNVEALRSFRETSSGIQKMLEPARHSGVKGGDILDQMINEIYLLDILEASSNEDPLDLEIESVDAFFMPKGLRSDSMMNLYGSKTRELGESATGRTSAELSASGTSLKFNSSWIGLSSDSRDVEDEYGLDLSEEKHISAGDKAFRSQECRFFTVEGERNLVGDLLHSKLYDADSGEELDVPDLVHDQLYRVLKKGVLNAVDKRQDSISEKETEIFMDTLYDIRDKAIESAGSYFDELEKAQKVMRQKVIEDKRILDPEKRKTIAG